MERKNVVHVAVDGVLSKLDENMKTYVLTLSKSFPRTHARTGEPTEFREKLLKKGKIHTIRANYELSRRLPNCGINYLSDTMMREFVRDLLRLAEILKVDVYEFIENCADE